MPDNTKKGVLYLCATPIGNLEDITLRALRMLREADLIAAEDTRHTRKLLSYYDIHTPLTSYHEHNQREKGAKLIADLQEGKNITLVSDAGTPGVSDPGRELVALAVNKGIRVVPVPGPAAVVTALIVSGLSTERFTFEGFLPRTKKERDRIISQLVTEERTMVFYESPNRVQKTLRELLERLGDREAAAARELTKAHEEIIRGRLSTVLEHFLSKPPKGEFTIVLEGRKPDKKEPSMAGPDEIFKLVEGLLQQGWDKKEALKKVAGETGVSKREVYDIVVKAEGRK